VSRRIDAAATDLVARLRLPVIAKGLAPDADRVARALARAACAGALGALGVLYRRLGGAG
jgi:hypothetical protein